MAGLRGVTGDGTDRPERRAVSTHGLHALDHSQLSLVGNEPLELGLFENDCSSSRTWRKRIAKRRQLQMLEAVRGVDDDALSKFAEACPATAR